MGCDIYVYGMGAMGRPGLLFNNILVTCMHMLWGLLFWGLNPKTIHSVTVATAQNVKEQ